jgi:hypothetical protein
MYRSQESQARNWENTKLIHEEQFEKNLNGVRALRVTPLLNPLEVKGSAHPRTSNFTQIQKRIINMKLAILTTLAVSAAAFAPSQVAQTSTSLNAFDSELGAQEPLGFFDPLGLVSDGSEAKFDRLRYVEIKHGRVSMLAVVGYLIEKSGIRLPGAISYDGTQFSDIPDGFAALSKIPDAGLFQLFAFIGFLEIFVMKDVTGGEFIGDFRNGFIDYGWDTFDEDTKLQKRAIELNQGRAAMMGILALMVHEKLGVSLIPGV